MQAAIAVSGVGFILMGGIALGWPAFVFKPFRASAASPDIRNEIRAVYGGFGLAVGTLLLSTPYLPAVGTGITLAVAVALLGMAAGRIVSFVSERTGPWPWVFCGIEIVLGSWLAATAL